jgi:hypothetical protein
MEIGSRKSPQEGGIGMVFEGFGKKISEAARNIGDKSHEIVETSKLQHEIHEAEEEIARRYAAIGQRYYEEVGRAGNAAETHREDCAKVLECEQAIEVLKLKVLRARGVTICTGCGQEIDRELKFCGQCGTKVVLPVFEDEAPEAPKA